MAIQVNGTTVIDDSRNLSNVGGLKTINGTSILGSGDIAAGASTTYDDVGTYVFGIRIQGKVVAGTTASGSSIREAVLYDNYTGTYNRESTVSGNFTFKGANTMSGTWRQMFDSDIGQTASFVRGGLWVRIS